VLLQNLEKNVDTIDLKREGKQVGTLPGKVFPGDFVPSLLERSEFRRDMRDAISTLIDKVGVYLANHCTTITVLALQFLFEMQRKLLMAFGRTRVTSCKSSLASFRQCTPTATKTWRCWRAAILSL
jgi:hypothetical protein